jgi:hypothetical protein
VPWTTNDLVAAVKRKGQTPTGGFQLDDPQILDIAFEATTKRYIPAIRGVREDFFTTFEAIPLVSGTASYRLPKRASSTTIKQVMLIDNTSGRACVVPRLPVSQGWRGLGLSTSAPYSYVIEGAQIRFLGTPNNVSTYTARVYYQRRPSRYVTSTAGTASSIVQSVTATTIVLTGAPAWWASGEQLDVMSPEPEADLLMQDVAVTLVGSTFTITDGTSTAQVTAGDYVAERDTTPIVLLPDAFMHSLIDATTAECLRSIGDYDAAASLEAGVAADLPNLLASIATRAESQPLPIRNSNAGLYQRGRGYVGGWNT